MTDLRKSDSQLDAEAQPLEERDLGEQIRLHRLMFRKDAGLPLRLHQRDGDDSGLGAPFNGIFVAYLDGAVGKTDSWNGALLWMRERVCRENHSKHWEPETWLGSLCYRMVSLVIRLEMDLEQASAKLGLTDEALTQRTLASALMSIENRLAYMLRSEMPEVKRSPSEWMAPVYEHQPLPGLHAEECPQCRRVYGPIRLDEVA